MSLIAQHHTQQGPTGAVLEGVRERERKAIRQIRKSKHLKDEGVIEATRHHPDGRGLRA